MARTVITHIIGVIPPIPAAIDALASGRVEVARTAGQAVSGSPCTAGQTTSITTRAGIGAGIAVVVVGTASQTGIGGAMQEESGSVDRQSTTSAMSSRAQTFQSVHVALST